MSTQTGAATKPLDTATIEAIAYDVQAIRTSDDYAVTFTLKPHSPAARALLMAWAREVA